MFNITCNKYFKATHILNADFTQYIKFDFY